MPKGYFSLVLHAHLPFVRHPEHEQFLEERWYFEAVLETYLPLLQILRGWERDELRAPFAITLSPTLCAMMDDALLGNRFRNYLENSLELAEKEVHRTHFDPEFQRIARFYLDRLRRAADFLAQLGGKLLPEFARHQAAGRIEILTCAATHAVLPLLAAQPECARAQIMVARDDYMRCFGVPPRGIWLPECAYAPWLDGMLKEAGLRWFVLESHGVLHGWPKPRYGVFAPVQTRGGLTAFGRDTASARQVWSREEGYPGDGDYRDFYRDIGFDLDLEYLRPHLGAPDQRGFTGFKYYRVTGREGPKEAYDRDRALAKSAVHAQHFLEQRLLQVEQLGAAMGQAPVIVAPYDAELFGHWWFEGPDFLDRLARLSQGSGLEWVTPGGYLGRSPIVQQVSPAPSSWGEHGYWHVWLNEKNEWIQRHLYWAQRRMLDLSNRYAGEANPPERMLRQAGRELLLAQSSDWPFIMHTGTSPDYARRRVEEHLDRFERLADGIEAGQWQLPELDDFEAQDNLLPGLEWRHFAGSATPK